MGPKSSSVPKCWLGLFLSGSGIQSERMCRRRTSEHLGGLHRISDLFSLLAVGERHPSRRPVPSFGGSGRRRPHALGLCGSSLVDTLTLCGAALRSLICKLLK